MSFTGGYQSDINLNDLNFASEQQRGIAQIATIQEVQNGADNTKIVTPAKLAAYVDGKITGVWNNKGAVDCSLNPHYPSGVGGEAYVVSAAGKIGGADGQRVGLRDVILCRSINPGGPESVAGEHWTIIQANLDQATELIAGYLRIATQSEIAAGLVDDAAVSPFKLTRLVNAEIKYKSGDAEGAIVPRAGVGNLASGNFAIITGGENNLASGNYSMANGQFAEATLFSQWAKAGAAFHNVRGSSQYSIFNLLGIIPSNIGTGALTLEGISSDGPSWQIPNNTVQQLSIQVSVVQNAGGEGSPGNTWTGMYEGTVRNQAGLVSWVGDTPSAHAIRQDPGFSPVVGFSFMNDAVMIYVVSMVGRSLFCSATVQLTQTKFSLP